MKNFLTTMGIMVAAAGLADAQPPKNAPAFEVASIHPSAPETRGVSIDFAPGGRFVASNVPLRVLIREAYGIRDFQLSGGPDWVSSVRYEIIAKAGIILNETHANETHADKDQVRAMLQTLLADRFKLVVRRELKDLNVYTLAAGKNGPRLGEEGLKEVKLDEENPSRGVRFRGLGRVAGVMASMSQLAVTLSDTVLNGQAILDRPVLDRTGLTGVYDFKLEWSGEEQSADGGASFNPAANPAGASIFTAMQQQLGLKLEATKAAVEVFIIDQAAKPTEN
jgi:uncharacterized protein (TIGR03435 family)